MRMIPAFPVLPLCVLLRKKQQGEPAMDVDKVLSSFELSLAATQSQSGMEAKTDQGKTRRVSSAEEERVMAWRCNSSGLLDHLASASPQQ
jgi:hypothetical protein